MPRVVVIRTNQRLDADLTFGELVNIENAISRDAIGAPLADGRNRNPESLRDAGMAPSFCVEPIFELHAQSLGQAKRYRQVLPKRLMFRLHFMKDAERKRAVREWYRTELGSDRKEFLRRTRLSKGRATQILTGEEPFGEAAAIKLARAVGLPDDRFLGQARAPPVDATLAEKHSELLRLWDPLFTEQKEMLIKAIRIEHQKAMAVMKEMKTRGLLKADVPEEVLPRQFTRPAQRDLAIGPIEESKSSRRRK